MQEQTASGFDGFSVHTRPSETPVDRQRPRINVYTCEGKAEDRFTVMNGIFHAAEGKGCGRSTVTRDIDDGTTPAILMCDCGGDQVSAWYACDQALTPSAEWYRPNAAQLTRLPRGIRQHVKDGGLVLRAIDTGADAIVGVSPPVSSAERHVQRVTAVVRTQAAMAEKWQGNNGRLNQARAFIKRAGKSAARRRIEKATRRKMRR
jgi:hypothetical protein